MWKNYILCFSPDICRSIFCFLSSCFTFIVQFYNILSLSSVLTCPSLPSQGSTAWILGMDPPPNVAVEPRPTESSLKRRWTMWAPSFSLLWSVTVKNRSDNSYRLTWGTHECQSHWRSPWAERISSCACWWRPWQGSQIHQYPERPPGPSGLQPRPTASWQRESGLLVTVVISHSNNNPWLVSHPYPHIFFLYFSDIFIITSR